jgi:DnaK suppressor protein
MTSHLAAAIPDDYLAQIRGELERRLRKLERLLTSRGDTRSLEIDQSAVGRLSRIETLQNQGLTQDLAERERTQREELLQALKRIEQGDFGRCSGCQRPIDLERLLVFPEARTCCGCQGAR